MATPTHRYRARDALPTTDSQLLVADASAIPALRHILEHQSTYSPDALQKTDVVAVVTSGDEVEDGLAEEWARRVRNLRDWGIPADDVVWVTFWFHGRPRP